MAVESAATYDPNSGWKALNTQKQRNYKNELVLKQLRSMGDPYERPAFLQRADAKEAAEANGEELESETGVGFADPRKALAKVKAQAEQKRLDQLA